MSILSVEYEAHAMGKEKFCTKTDRILYQENLTAGNIQI
jgi:hypothetical protein